MIVTYECNGRFGNNIIQYLAAKLFAQKFRGLFLPIGQYQGAFTKKLTDVEWSQAMLNDPSFVIDEKGKYLCNEYYQRGDILLQYKDQVLSCMSDTAYFDGKQKFCDIFKNVVVPEDTIVVHLRLDDYNFQGQSNVVDPNFFISEIQASGKTKARLIVDKLRYQNEYKYIQLIVTACPTVQFTLQQDSVLQDWNTLRCANYVISSNSSYAWTACFFGKCQQSNKVVIYPDTKFYQTQNFSLTELDGWRNVMVARKDFNSL